MSKDEHNRKEAIRRYLAGESISSICENMSRSRKWFYKWQHRYESGDPEWFKEQSRAPHRQNQQISEELEATIITVRKELMKKKYGRVGPQSIDWELRRLGYEPPPSLSTIKRVLKRHNLLKPKKDSYRKKATPYPEIPALFPNSVHLVDFWGPRHIRGDGRFYSLNTMDVYTRRVNIHPVRHKRHQAALEGLGMAWEKLGEPDYAQFDNALSFRGSNRYPRSFGPVIRWCLLNKVEPIFIPQGEPWRNGCLEKFHDTLENQFFRQITFNDFEHFCTEAKEFNEYHNQFYRYSPLGGSTPNETYKKDRLRNDELAKKYTVAEYLPLTDGEIHLVRLIRSDLKLNIFGETFPVPEDLKYEYVIATICTADHKIVLRDSQWKYQLSIEYRLPE